MTETLQLSMDALDEPCTIDLRTDEAPDTCEAILDALPIEGSLVHAIYSGQEAFAPLSEDLQGLDPENWEYDVAAGDVGYWDSGWGDGLHGRSAEPLAELVIIYGRRAKVRRGPDRPTPINLIGRVSENLDALAEVCGRLPREGEKEYRLERA